MAEKQKEKMEEPEIKKKQQEAKTEEQDNNIKKHEKKMEEPETKAKQQEAKTEEQDNNLKKHEKKMEVPETKTKQQETKTEEQDNNIKKHEKKMEEPETKTKQQEAKTEEQDNNIKKHEKNMEEPEVKTEKQEFNSKKHQPETEKEEIKKDCSTETKDSIEEAKLNGHLIEYRKPYPPHAIYGGPFNSQEDPESAIMRPWCTVFKYLKPKELAKLRMLNKEFERLIDIYTCFDELIIFNKKTEHMDKGWKFSYVRSWAWRKEKKLIENHVKSRDFQRTELILRNKLFSHNLRKLCFELAEVSIETVNEFDRLVILEFHVTTIKDTVRFHAHFRLPMLIGLKAHGLYTESGRAAIFSAPKLKQLSGGCILVYPESLRVLVGCLENEMINLEYIYANCIYWDSGSTFTTFPKLKLFQFIKPSVSLSLINSLYRTKRDCPNVKIYCVLLELDLYPEEIKIEGAIDTALMFKLHAQNYSKLADLCPTIGALFYNEIENAFYPQKVPTDFLPRFNELVEITVVEDLKYADNFLKVLSKCREIRRLDLPSSLGQAFYDGLHAALPDLRYLRIEGDKPALECSFISNFDLIIEFKARQQPLKLEVWGKLLRKPYLEKVTFLWKNITVKIVMKHEPSYNVKTFKVVDENEYKYILIYYEWNPKTLDFMIKMLPEYCTLMELATGGKTKDYVYKEPRAHYKRDWFKR